MPEGTTGIELLAFESHDKKNTVLQILNHWNVSTTILLRYLDFSFDVLAPAHRQCLAAGGEAAHAVTAMVFTRGIDTRPVLVRKITTHGSFVPGGERRPHLQKTPRRSRR